MTIIEAFVKAETGKRISNKSMLLSGQYLMYKANGVFIKYKVREMENSEKTTLELFQTSNFHFGNIIDISWCVVDKDLNVIEQ